jgi:hypothetical protein
MSRGFRVASALVLVAVAGVAPARAQPTEDPTVVRVFSIEYADGRIVKSPVRDKFGAWTAQFPRVPGAQTTNEGLALAALDVSYVADGRDLTVTVALRYGTPHEKLVPVATVKVTDGRPVRVEELTALGVQPITLAIASMARPDLPIPSVTTPSSQLETSVDVDTKGPPRYRISITNHSQRSVMALAFVGYRGQALGPSGKPHKLDQTPLIAAGATYVINLEALPNGRSSNPSDPWLAIDRIVITSVTWSDGTVEGSERPAAETRVVDAATARQLARALTQMRGAQAVENPDLAQLRAAILSLSIDDPGAARAAASDPKGVDAAAAMSLTRIGAQLAKDALMKDFDEFLSDPRSADPASRRSWLASAVEKFDGWRTRIVTAPR